MSTSTNRATPLGYLGFFLFGVYFGTVLIKGEVISWFRIQEMFRFQSFHMYGVLGSGVATAALSLWLLQRFGKPELRVASKGSGSVSRFLLGGICFGLGWGLTGACPGPIFALLGAGEVKVTVVLLGALLGAWTYATLRERLPH
jgi:hypothetical protein